jgi:hypothetical protein
MVQDDYPERTGFQLGCHIAGVLSLYAKGSVDEPIGPTDSGVQRTQKGRRVRWLQSSPWMNQSGQYASQPPGRNVYLFHIYSQTLRVCVPLTAYNMN